MRVDYRDKKPLPAAHICDGIYVSLHNTERPSSNCAFQRGRCRVPCSIVFMVGFGCFHNPERGVEGVGAVTIVLVPPLKTIFDLVMLSFHGEKALMKKKYQNS